MTATRWLIGCHLRRRWVALVPIALIVALGATGTFVAAGAAHRTARAYARYLDRAEVGDVVLLSTAEIDKVIRNLPGVRSVTTDALFFAGIDDGTPRTRCELGASAQTPQVRGSVDGRYTRMDRPALAEGRFPAGPDEALVSVELADARGVEVGDVVPLSLWSPLDCWRPRPR